MKKRIKIILFITLILGLFASQFFIDLSPFLPIPQVVGWLQRAGHLAPLLLISMMTVAVILSPIPSLPLDLAAGAFFGPFMGTLYSVAGSGPSSHS